MAGRYGPLEVQMQETYPSCRFTHRFLALALGTVKRNFLEIIFRCFLLVDSIELKKV